MKICDKCNTSYVDSIVTNMNKCSCGGNLIISQEYKRIHTPEPTTPRCPTCNSTKVRRITGTEKLTSTVVFGIFSNKRKQQFECLNPKCRYKW